MKQSTAYETLSIFFGDISVMIGSGQTMDEIIESLSSDAEGAWKKTLCSMVSMLSEGESLWSAMDKTGSFPSYAIRMIRSAEESGRLEEASGSLSLFYGKREQMRSLADSALVQPLILLSLLALILGVFLAVILPVISGVYESLGGVQSAYVTAGYVIGIAAFVFLFAVLAVLLRIKSEMKAKGFENTSSLKKIPATAKILKKSELAFFMSDFSTAVSGGIVMDEAFARAADNVEDKNVKNRLLECSRAMAVGESLSSALRTADVLPHSVMHVISSGIANGNIESAIVNAAELLFKEVEVETENMVKKVEPALTGIFTLAIGVSLLCVLLPLIAVITSIG